MGWGWIWIRPWWTHAIKCFNWTRISIGPYLAQFWHYWRGWPLLIKLLLITASIKSISFRIIYSAFDKTVVCSRDYFQARYLKLSRLQARLHRGQIYWVPGPQFTKPQGVLQPDLAQFRSCEMWVLICLIIQQFDRRFSCRGTCRFNSDVIMGAMASQITSVSIVYSTVCSGTDQRKRRSSASLAFVGGIPRCIPRTKGQVTRKMSPFDDVIMKFLRGSVINPNTISPSFRALVPRCFSQKPWAD